MYLSRLYLNTMNRRVWRDIKDCHQMHRTVLSLFPQTEKSHQARKAFGILYRLELHHVNNRVVLYIQSEHKPDFSKLISSSYLLPSSDVEDNPSCKLIDEALSNIKNGTILRFRLKANPTKKIGTTKKEDRANGKPICNGKRVPFIRTEDQIEWLKRKGLQHGFRLLEVNANTDSVDVAAKKELVETGYRLVNTDNGIREPKYKKLTFNGVVFDGHLVVADAETFLNAIKNGVGSGKAYGFGMLSVAKPQYVGV